MPNGKINSLRASTISWGHCWRSEGVGLPGGCFLGPRPIDLHIKGFEALGAKVTNEHGAMYLRTEEEGLTYLPRYGLHRSNHQCDAGSSKSQRQTIIENAAREPEIIDVATLLNNMGAKIRGAGTNEIRIEGVEEFARLSSFHHSRPDRSRNLPFFSRSSGEGITVKNVIYEHLESYIAKLEEIGVRMDISEDEIYVHPSKDLKPATVKTYPYPGFATDLQQPITPLLLKAKGTSEIMDTIYAKRVNHIPELARMGAQATTEGNMIFVSGPSQLHGAEVVASDLRAGACLVIAGLMATGTTSVFNVEYILRGYDHIIEKLTALGADIQMIEE